MESLGAGVAAAALPADPDRAHRLVVAATARAGDAGYRDRDGGAGVDQRAGHHFHHGLAADRAVDLQGLRSEEHTSELQSLMRISYAVFCLKKKRNDQNK